MAEDVTLFAIASDRLTASSFRSCCDGVGSDIFLSQIKIRIHVFKLILKNESKIHLNNLTIQRSQKIVSLYKLTLNTTPQSIYR